MLLQCHPLSHIGTQLLTASAGMTVPVNGSLSSLLSSKKLPVKHPVVFVRGCG